MRSIKQPQVTRAASGETKSGAAKASPAGGKPAGKSAKPAAKSAKKAADDTDHDTDFGQLPEWDLSDLYKGPDDPAVAKDVADASRDALGMKSRYQGHLADIAKDGGKLAVAIKEYEALADLVGKLGSYSGLYYTQNQADLARAKFNSDYVEAQTSKTFSKLNQPGLVGNTEKCTATCNRWYRHGRETPLDVAGHFRYGNAWTSTANAGCPGARHSPN